MRAFVLTMLVTVSACAAVQDPDVAPPPDVLILKPTKEDPCGARAYQELVGTNLAAVTMPDDLNARTIRPGQFVTMEYIASRMNIHVDEDGAIQRVTCG